VFRPPFSASRHFSGFSGPDLPQKRTKSGTLPRKFFHAANVHLSIEGFSYVHSFKRILRPGNK
jgi:hypothetical protein